MNWSEFFNMGGYGFYVWTSYGIAMVVLLANIVAPIIGGRNLRRELAGKLRREQSQ